MKRASLGAIAHLGWATTSILVVEKGAPRVLRTDRIETADPADRHAKEPFHVAGGFEGLVRVPRPADPKASLQLGLKKQRRFTEQALAQLGKQLAAQHRKIVSAGIAISRGRPAKTFEKAIGSHTQIHIEEGIVVRESLSLALTKNGARVHEVDQRSLVEIACEELAQKQCALMALLAETAPENQGPWRKEEKLAALAAWIAWLRPRKRR